MISLFRRTYTFASRIYDFNKSIKEFDAYRKVYEEDNPGKTLMIKYFDVDYGLKIKYCRTNKQAAR